MPFLFSGWFPLWFCKLLRRQWFWDSCNCQHIAR